MLQVQGADQGSRVGVRLAPCHPAHHQLPHDLILQYAKLDLEQAHLNWAEPISCRDHRDGMAQLGMEYIYMTCMHTRHIECALLLLKAGASMTYKQYLLLHGAVSLIAESAMPGFAAPAVRFPA